MEVLQNMIIPGIGNCVQEPDGSFTPAATGTRHALDIGIDAGVHTGIAAKDMQTSQWVILKTVSFWEAIDTLQKLNGLYVIRRVVIEDPSQNKPVFMKNGMPRSHVSQYLKIAQNVGMNKRDAMRLIEYCERHGWTVQAVRPTSKSLTKLSSKRFQQLTGIKQRTSEHVRDAAMLIA